MTYTHTHTQQQKKTCGLVSDQRAQLTPPQFPLSNLFLFIVNTPCCLFVTHPHTYTHTQDTRKKKSWFFLKKIIEYPVDAPTGSSSSDSRWFWWSGWDKAKYCFFSSFYHQEHTHIVTHAGFFFFWKFVWWIKKHSLHHTHVTSKEK